MQSIPSHSVAEADESYELVAVEAVLAGTMALMTGFAQATPLCPNRPAMAGKLVANLLLLSDHPGLSATMHRVMQRLAAHWQREQERLGGAACLAAVGRHPAPAALQ